MTRDKLINRLLREFRAAGITDLLNKLQDEGFVSDEVVVIQDVADCDLIKAYQKFDK